MQKMNGHAAFSPRDPTAIKKRPPDPCQLQAVHAPPALPQAASALGEYGEKIGLALSRLR